MSRKFLNWFKRREKYLKTNASNLKRLRCSGIQQQNTVCPFKFEFENSSLQPRFMFSSPQPQFLFSSPQPKFMFRLNSVPCVIRWTWKYPGTNVILAIEFYCKEWEPKLEFILALLMPRWCWLTKILILVTLILSLGFCFVEFPPALAVVLFINKLKLMCPWIG